MSKRNSAPTMGWVIGSNITRWLALVFFIQWLVTIIAVYGVWYHLNQSCYNTHESTISLFGYDISLYANHDIEACLDGS